MSAQSEIGLGFLAGGGEMGRLIRSFDWAAHPLGRPEAWPQGLKTALRLLLSTGHPMFLWWSPDLHQFYNDAYSRSIGPERHPSALGQRGRECWVEIWDIIGPQIERVMTGGGHTWNENQLVPITRHGRREDVYWTYSYGPIDDPGAPNGIGGVLVVCTETTEQVLAEQRMREAEARWRSLFEQTPGFVCIFEGPEHVFEFANDRYRDLVGHRELIGRPLRQALPEVEEQGFSSMLDEVYKTGRPHRGAASPVSLQGTAESGETRVYLDFACQPIRDGHDDVVGIFVAGHEVTEQVLAHRELRREDRRKDEFLAMLAHELRNPLAPIRSAGELLIRNEQGDDGIAAIGELISRQVTQIARLVDDLLDVSRITHDRIELRRKPLRLEAVLAQAVESVQPQLAGKLHAVVPADDGEPIWVEGDAVRLVQSLSNLLTNAAKYTPDGGRIETRLRRQGAEALLEVTDTGIGIGEEMLGEVFELFAQVDQSLDRSQSGLGVGLFVVRRLVEMHGGRVEARSDGLGHGSTFSIHLPTIEAPAPSTGSRPTAELRPQHILVVDDHADAADSLVDLLRLSGHQAESVHDPYQAIERVRETAPAVVLLDIGLPGIDGYEVARRLRAAGSGSLLVALTGYGRSEDVKRAREAGFDAHLTKPVSYDDLRGVLVEHQR